MRIWFGTLLLVIGSFTAFGQEIRKENLTKKKSNYYDFEKTKLESIGSYYVDPLGETTEKHGKWNYFNEKGDLIEERNYYRGKLNGAVKANFGNGKPKQEGYFILDQQDSISREWYETGQLNVEGYYKNGKPVGNWTYYYLSGKKKSEEEIIANQSYIRNFWIDDSLHTQTITAGNGELFTYYNTGSQKEYYAYKNGLKHGSFEEYSIYGYLTLSGAFKDGLKDSTWTYHYYTGDIEKISTYKNGVLNGPYVYYFDKNRINVKGNYLDGKKDGLWTWYTNKGTKDMEGNFKQDKQDGDWTYWYPTGEVSYKAKFKDDLKEGLWIYYYKNGKEFKKGTFKNDLKDGLWETWYESGQLLMTGKYKEGKEEGLWQNYWENGELKNESGFEKGELSGVWKSYYPSGKPKLTGTYKKGLKTGEWIDFFENGKPKDLVSYKVIKDKSKIEYGYLKDFDQLESVKHGAAVSFSDKDFKKIEEGEYDNGEKTGTWIDYYPGGRIPAVTQDYKNGKLHGKLKEFDRRGNLMSEIEYKDGLKHGSMKVYDKKGKVAVQKTFENGQQVVIPTGGKTTQFGTGR